ncbi:hypothetical protein NKJ13_28430 [Mesorhizobium sp. M0174]
MPALRVVKGVDESADALAGIICILIGETLHLFLLQGFHEALRLRVIVRIANTAHARLETVKMQKFGVDPAGMLSSAVGEMRKAPGFGLAISDGHLESLDDKRCSEMRIQRPSDHLAAKRQAQRQGKQTPQPDAGT